MVDNSKGTALPPMGEILSQPTVTVKVGQGRKDYHLHKTLLTHYSGFFRGAFRSQVFKEAQDGVVPLLDTTPAVFNIFASWLYTGKLEHYNEWGSAYLEPSEEGQTKEDFVRAYAFADRFLVPDFKVAIMDVAFESYSNTPPWYVDVAYAFENLPAESPFIKLLVDSHVDRWGGPEYDERWGEVSPESLPSQFLYVVTARMKEVWRHPGLECAIRNRLEYAEPAPKDHTNTKKKVGAEERTG